MEKPYSTSERCLRQCTERGSPTRISVSAARACAASLNSFSDGAILRALQRGRSELDLEILRRPLDEPVSDLWLAQQVAIGKWHVWFDVEYRRPSIKLPASARCRP